MTTYFGNLPQITDWEESWEVFFAKGMKQAIELRVKAKGRDQTSMFCSLPFSTRSYLVCCAPSRAMAGRRILHFPTGIFSMPIRC